MRKLLFMVALGLFLAGTANASGFYISAGPFAQYRDTADVTAGPDLNGHFRIADRWILEGGYAMSGEGAQQSIARLGLHYLAVRFGDADNLGLVVGAGGIVKAFGVEYSDGGVYGAAALDFEIPVFGEYLAGYEFQGKISRNPEPTAKIKFVKVMRF